MYWSNINEAIDAINSIFFFFEFWVLLIQTTKNYIQSKSIKTNSNKLKGPALRKLTLPLSDWPNKSLYTGNFYTE